MRKDNTLNIIGMIYLALGILALLNSLYNKNFSQLLWGCYLGLIILGIGVLKREGLLVGSQISILAIPLIFWNIDFFYHVITEKSLWGITDYMFSRSLNLSTFVSLQHVITLPLGIYCLKNMQVKRFDFWKIAFLQVIMLFLLASIFTNPQENINCSFKPCVNFTIGLPYYFEWFIAFCLMIVVTNAAIWFLLKRNNLKA